MQQVVLILVLVEDTLEVVQLEEDDVIYVVLILVLVEDTLEDLKDVQIKTGNIVS